MYNIYIYIYIYVNLLQSSLNCWFPSPSPLPGWLWGFPVRSASYVPYVPCPPPSGGRSDSHEISQTWLQGTRGAEMVLGPWGRWARRKVARFGVFFEEPPEIYFCRLWIIKKRCRTFELSLFVGCENPLTLCEPRYWWIDDGWTVVGYRHLLGRDYSNHHVHQPVLVANFNDHFAGVSHVGLSENRIPLQFDDWESFSQLKLRTCPLWGRPHLQTCPNHIVGDISICIPMTYIPIIVGHIPII